jgi:cytochrome P450 / NADPH-cytochrome P450 reductase
MPTNEPVLVAEVLAGYVELSQPATSRDIQDLLSILSTSKSDSATIQQALQSLISNYNEEVQAKRVSVLDILEQHPSLEVPFGVFLFMLPAMRIRQYSISSSPLWSPEKATLTITVLSAPALASKERVFSGVASSYLAGLLPGDQVLLSVRPSAVAFHPPTDPTVPIVMFCAGSGIAPMRGFIQERAAQKLSGRSVGKALLFFGCRCTDDDYLYMNSDLKQWVEDGVVDVRPAFSREKEVSEGCKYVQE